jgi:4-diphosphocytidyl-2-C-methyl-D-erythritol kinase
MSGRGEILKDIACAKPLNLFMMLPPAAVSTAACYKAFDSMHVSIPASSQSVEEALAKGDLEALGSSMSNMLMAPAAKLNADIRRCIDQLKAYGPLGVNMTGSGSCVYAIFEDEQLCRYAQSRYYGKFKTLITKTCRID